MAKVSNNASKSKKSTSVDTCETNVYSPVYNIPLSHEDRVIDSFKLRIPFDLVSVENDILNDEYVVYSRRTGEEIEDENFKRSAYHHKYDGITTHYKIENQVTRYNSVQKYLVILITSKILGPDYFKGIQKTTVYDVYTNLMNENIVGFTFKTFMMGECTDMDIKFDFIPKVDATTLVKGLYKQAVAKVDAHKGCSVYKKKTNLGIQFSLRKTQAFLTSPYLKFYEKIRELNSKSLDFFNAYLFGFNLPPEVVRCETTIKNKKHFKSLGEDSTVFSDIIVNLDRISEKAFRKAFKAHIMDYTDNYNVEAIEKSKTLNINDRILYGYIETKVNTGMSFDNAIKFVIIKHAANKQERYKLKKRLNGIFEKVDKPSVDKDNKSEFDRWFSSISGS